MRKRVRTKKRIGQKRRSFLLCEEIYGRVSFFLLSFCCFYLLTTARWDLLKPLYLESPGLYLDSRDMAVLVRVIFLLNFGLLILAGYGRRSLLNLFQVVLFPFLACWTLRYFAWGALEPGILLFILALPWMLFGADRAALLWQRLKRRKRRLLFRSLVGGGRGLLTAWLLCFCLLAGTVGSVFDTDIIDVSEETEDYSAQRLWSRNRDSLSMLREEAFAELPEEEKLRVLQKIVELEMIGFGIDKVKLAAFPMENEYEAGYYDVAASAIVINDRLLEEGVEASFCLDTVLHECYHAYELSCILERDRRSLERNPKLYEKTLLWQEELQSYQTVGAAPSWEEYMAYYGQTVEEDARTYAAQRGAAYLAYTETPVHVRCSTADANSPVR